NLVPVDAKGNPLPDHDPIAVRNSETGEFNQDALVIAQGRTRIARKSPRLLAGGADGPSVAEGKDETIATASSNPAPTMKIDMDAVAANIRTLQARADVTEA